VKGFSAGSRKRRTRGHIIADLAVHHLEGQVLRCGYTVEGIRHDYGLDLLIRTFDAEGRQENGDIRCQVKATANLPVLAGQAVIAWRVAAADLRHWLNEPTPVILVVYDAVTDTAFWLNVQDYFERRRTELGGIGATVTLHIPLAHLLNIDAVRGIARYRDDMLANKLRRIPGHE
jgi:hypothetical protein